MAKFHTLTINDVRKETADCVSIAFSVPAQLQPEYKFTQGQYLTLKLNVAGEELRRSYSICSNPYTDNELRVAVKQVNNGKGSTYINKNLKVGDQVEVMTPMGNFYSLLSGANKKQYLLFAGGSGITPMMSILKSVLYIEKQSSINLVYANRDEASVIFDLELRKLQEQNKDRLNIHFVYDAPKQNVDPLYSGILSAEKVSTLLDKFNLQKADEIFICGPGPLMETIKSALTSKKIEDKKIHIEYFSAVLDTIKKAESASAGSSEVRKVTVIQYGIETQLDLATDGSSILDAALDAGVDVPFACKGAVCCTCRAKVLEGKVSMDANFALTDKEVSQGYILTCQSHPITDKVIVDYDAS